MVKNELCFRITKIIDIVYVSIISFALVFIAALFSDKLFGPFNEEELNKKKELYPNFSLYLAILLIFVVSYTGIINYILRNIIQLIPSPLNGVCGLRHTQISEIRSIPSTIFLLLFIYQYELFTFSRDYFIKYLT